MNTPSRIGTWLERTGATETRRHTTTERDVFYDELSTIVLCNPVAAKLLRTIAYTLTHGKRFAEIRLDGTKSQNQEVQSIADRLRNIGVLSSARLSDNHLRVTLNTRDKQITKEVVSIVKGQLYERAARNMTTQILGDSVEVVSNLEGTSSQGTFELDLVVAWPNGTICVVEAKSPREIGRGLARFRKVCDQLNVPAGNAIMLSRDINETQAADARAFHGIELLDGMGFQEYLRDFDPSTAHIDSLSDAEPTESQITLLDTTSGTNVEPAVTCDPVLVQSAISICNSEPNQHDLGSLSKAVRDKNATSLRHVSPVIRHLIVTGSLRDAQGASVRKSHVPIALAHDPSASQIPGIVATSQPPTAESTKLTWRPWRRIA